MARRDAKAFPFDRIFNAAVLSGQGSDAVNELLKLFDDEDSAVRFWAVIGLTNTARREEPVVDALQRALNDPSVEVRIVAAEALCRIDRESVAVALPVLLDTLMHKSEWVRLQAANSLDRIGQKARPAIDAIRKAAEDPSRENMFVRWVMAHTLQQLVQERDKGNE